MDDERWYKHTSAFDTKSSSGKRRKIDNNNFLLLSVFLLLPEEDLVSKALVCLYHCSSSIGEYSFLVLFLTCLPHQQLLPFSSKCFEKASSFKKTWTVWKVQVPVTIQYEYTCYTQLEGSQFPLADITSVTKLMLQLLKTYLKFWSVLFLILLHQSGCATKWII